MIGTCVAPEPTTAIAELLERWSRTNPDSDSGPTRALNDRALLAPLREFLGRRGKQLRGWLVDLGFRLGGGAAGACPAELALMVEALHAGSLIIDDIEDGSEERRGAAALHKLYGVPVALNAGNWLYFWPQVLLAEMPLPDHVRLRAHECIAKCLLRCHAGQALDLTVRVWDVPQGDVLAVVRAIAEQKTGGLLELASALGAIAAGADRARVDAIGRFGREVGLGLQMLDDLSGVLADARRHKGVEDLQHGRATWIWAWLSEDVDPATYRGLIEELRACGSTADGPIERVREHIGDAGLRRARAQLDCAVAALRAAGGDDLRAHEVARELAWLERCYVPT